MLLRRAPFRAYVEEVTAIAMKDLKIKDTDGKTYDEDMYYVYSFIDQKAGIKFRILAAAKREPFEILSDKYNANVPWNVVKTENLIPHPVKEDEIRNRFKDVIREIEEKYACPYDVRETRFWGWLDLMRKPDHPDIITAPYNGGDTLVTVQIIGLDGAVPYCCCLETGRMMKLYYEGSTVELVDA